MNEKKKTPVDTKVLKTVKTQHTKVTNIITPNIFRFHCLAERIPIGSSELRQTMSEVEEHMEYMAAHARQINQKLEAITNIVKPCKKTSTNT